MSYICNIGNPTHCYQKYIYKNDSIYAGIYFKPMNILTYNSNELQYVNQ